MIIFRYLSKELFSTLLAITLVLLIIFITNQFIHYLKDAADGHITMTAVMQIMSLQVPLLLGYLLPLGLYLSILIAYGRLCVDHEMTVLSSCGVSRAQLMGITMLVSLFVMFIVAVLMLWLEPIVEGYSSRILARALTNASIQKVVPKRFQELPNRRTIYAEHVSQEHRTMHHIFMAKIGEHDNKWDVTLAKSAREGSVKGLKGNFIIFQNGRRYIGLPGQKDFQIVQFQDYGVRLASAKVHLQDWPSNVPTFEIWHMIHTEKNPHRLRLLEGMLQWRLAMPISVLLFALLAFPLSDVKPRSGKFARLFPAILIYIVYADLMFLGRAWIERGAISPSLGLWWVHGFALFLGILLNIHRIGWRRCFSFVWLRRADNANA